MKKLEDIPAFNPDMLVSVKHGAETLFEVFSITPERVIELRDQADAMKKEVVGDKPNVSLATIFGVVSRVAANANELAFLCASFGKSLDMARLAWALQKGVLDDIN